MLKIKIVLGNTDKKSFLRQTAIEPEIKGKLFFFYSKNM